MANRFSDATDLERLLDYVVCAGSMCWLLQDDGERIFDYIAATRIVEEAKDALLDKPLSWLKRGKTVKSNTPNMNIANQINAGLNDVRATLIDFSCLPRYGYDHAKAIAKARYQLDAICDMINEHKEGNSVPWSDRKYLVEEEFGK